MRTRGQKERRYTCVSNGLPVFGKLEKDKNTHKDFGSCFFRLRRGSVLKGADEDKARAQGSCSAPPSARALSPLPAASRQWRREHLRGGEARRP